MFKAGLVLVALIAVPVRAEDYPKDPEGKDKLCEAIGETPNVAIPPRDRLWFKDECFCMPYGCGVFGSVRMKRLSAAYEQALAEEKKRQAAEAAGAKIRAEEARKAAAERDRKARIQAAKDRQEEERQQKERAEFYKREEARLAAEQELERKTKEETNAKREATADLRKAFWECWYRPPNDCKEPARVLEAACEQVGLNASYKDKENDREDCYRR